MADGFEEWLQSLGIGRPDAGDQVGSPRAGAMDFLRELYDARGPVSVAEVDAARRDREIRLITSAAELVEADIVRTTRLRPRIEVQVLYDRLVAATYNGNVQAPTILSLREPESIVEVADNLRDHVVDDLWTVWPLCPRDGAGLDPQVIDGRAAWHCRNGQHTVSDIGQLSRPAD